MVPARSVTAIGLALHGAEVYADGEVNPLTNAPTPVTRAFANTATNCSRPVVLHPASSSTYDPAVRGDGERHAVAWRHLPGRPAPHGGSRPVGGDLLPSIPVSSTVRRLTRPVSKDGPGPGGFSPGREGCERASAPRRQTPSATTRGTALVRLMSMRRRLWHDRERYPHLTGGDGAWPRRRRSC